jgi:hypothetical protein
MPGTVRFHYDEVNDIHFAYPKWYIETEADCRQWLAQFVEYFSPLGRKVDAIIVLDEFRIGPKIGSVWGKYRAEWILKFTRYSVRVNAQARAATFTATSAALYGGGFEEAKDVEAAVGFIHARRRADGVK